MKGVHSKTPDSDSGHPHDSKVSLTHPAASLVTGGNIVFCQIWNKYAMDGHTACATISFKGYRWWTVNCGSVLDAFSSVIIINLLVCVYCSLMLLRSTLVVNLLCLRGPHLWQSKCMQGGNVVRSYDDCFIWKKGPHVHLFIKFEIR